MENTNERIDLINIEDEMQRAYIDYSMSVIVGRALPDVRDGMKPGNRRILYAMKERGWTHSKAYVKCAKVVGEVIGNYHPHGDTAVYDTMVRMAQDFAMRGMLIDGQGNFGSIDGDRAAAYRYTECRLRPLAEEMLADIDKETVDMRPNFDESLMEPTVLPARVPNLLVNGSTGIAVGMATNIPPHNLGEVIDGTILLIDNPEATIDELHELIKGPDFPTGGTVYGLNAVRDFYTTGRGKIKVRGKATIEEDDNGKARIIITEIPYALNKTLLITKMVHLVRDKKLEGISDIRDESGKEGIRLVIELKRNAVPNVLLNNIFKHTQMESTFGGIMLAIDKGKPRVLNLKETLQCFVDHRFEVITRRTEFDLKKAKARAHILEGYLLAMDNMDEVVRIIRDSKNREEAQERLMTKFGFSEIQAKAILEMRLYQLTGLERDKVEAEYAELMELITYLEDLLAHPEKIFSVIKEDLEQIRAKYGEHRRTDLSIDEGEIDIEDLIADEPCVITLSSTGYIKRVPTDTYRQQRRGGKGVMGMNTKDEDFVEHIFSASTHDYLLCFTEAGRMYWLKAYYVPEGTRQSRGRSLANVLQMAQDEKLAAILCVRELDDHAHNLIMATRKGIIKKTVLAAYKNVRVAGVKAINIDEDDELIGVRLSNGEDQIILSMKNGKAIRFKETDARPLGRVSRGVKGVTLTGDDEVVTIEIVDTESTMMAITENGYGKRTSFDEYRTQTRGGKGIISIQTTDRNGKVVSAHAVTEEHRLMLISEGGQMICIGASDLRVIGRNTQGVRLFNLKEGDKLVAAAVLDPEEDAPEVAEGEEVLAEGAEGKAPVAEAAPEEASETEEPSED
ncbi:DNA gyrase subunit A [Pontiella sulfatireligans]|uniref:DNA gyrase subunit A n=1 Tax=Pontiella sulfatireligans TaxID=2750658 RepID=A0A6C2UMB2_9BACT|nr:DNA gyrase subunit A [Pontiella sulfatireligans]VGO21412.1 DNA gyrase subunit A [Pontiella sulfatireligans]